MQITASSKKLSELLPIQGDDNYKIPDYQRSYSWKEDQIEQLFSDIAAEDSGYYIGNILITDNINSSDTKDVIDGQQRLVTISLFLLAIWQRLDEWDQITDVAFVHSPQDGDYISYKRDIKRQLLCPGEHAKPRMDLLASDREIYCGLLSVLSGEKPGRFGKRSFFKRYEYIRSIFDDADKFSECKDLINFYNRLQATNILFIQVPDLGNAFNVFSSLNAKGLPLSLVDLLKSEFIGALAGTDCTNTEAVSEWTKFSETFCRIDGDIDESAETQFMLNNYDAFENSGASAITKGKALQKYQRIIKDKYQAGEDYLKTLTVRADDFAHIIQLDTSPYISDEVAEKLRALNKLQATQAYPLMLFIFNKRDELDVVHLLPNILDILITFYVRRNITLVPKSSNIRSSMLELIKKIRQQHLQGTDVFNLILKSLKNDSDDSRFINAIQNDPLYDRNAKTTRYVLIDLERNALPGNRYFDKSNLDTLDDASRWTIEHILPEGSNLPDYWKDAISPDDRAAADDVQQKNVHRIGNLTLTPYNSELKQLPFVDDSEPYSGEETYKKSKRDYKLKGKFHGMREGLRLNASIPNKNAGETLENKASWTITDIDRRTKYLSEIMLERYKFPKKL